jgi:hypothetical protein
MKKRATVVPARLHSPWNRSFARMTGGLQVAQEVAHAVLGRIGQGEVIPAGERLQQHFVEELVDLEEIAVHRLERVVGLVIGLDRGGVRRIGLGRTAGGKHGNTERGCNQRDAKLGSLVRHHSINLLSAVGLFLGLALLEPFHRPHDPTTPLPPKPHTQDAGLHAWPDRHTAQVNCS